MSRPFTKFPANHHLSQLLERIIVVGAIERVIGRASAITLELGAFNGNDPIGPFAAPAWRRFGDSWSSRATLSSRTADKDLEAQVSHARVRSPDIIFGGGLDQRKRSGSLRAEFPSRRWRPYGLIEYAATGTYDKGLRAFAYTTWLAEASVRSDDFELGVRFERTDRPEEGRTSNSFRSPRPPHDLSNLGTTRWHIVSGRLARTYARALAATVFAEGSVANATRLIPNSVFDPNVFYGTSHLWTVATGLRLAVGVTQHARMGRYGVAESSVASAVSGHRHR